MPFKTFLQALLPIWLIELVLCGFYLAFGSEQVTFISITLFVISSVLLPFLAGLRVVKTKGNIGFAILGAVSISFVTLFTVALNNIFVGSNLEAFLGFVIATLIFAVVPQAIFGSVGGYFARKQNV